MMQFYKKASALFCLNKPKGLPAGVYGNTFGGITLILVLLLTGISIIISSFYPIILPEIMSGYLFLYPLIYLSFFTAFFLLHSHLRMQMFPVPAPYRKPGRYYKQGYSPRKFY